MGLDSVNAKSTENDNHETDRPLVLELQNVSFTGRSEQGLRLQDVDLKARRGDLVTIEIDAVTRTRETASMMQGMVPPHRGRLTFCSQDWLGDNYERHYEMRSRIGRVFEGQAWIENLNVDENVTISCRNFGENETDLQEDLRRWLEHLGLDRLSRKRPAFVEPSLLQIHQWIRAFLGSPILLILERPLQHLSSEWLPKMLQAIEHLRASGTAVVWFATDRELAGIPSAAPMIRWKLLDNKLQQAGGSDRNE